VKRILFVDDEQRILDGLRRLLRDKRAEWDMVFVDSGTKALEQLRAASFDIVVTDMRMPGMDGAALLAHVKEEFPDVVRLVLSGYSDPEATMRAVPVCHQFLNKPCDVNLLKETIARTCALRALLAATTLQSIVGEMGLLPSLPRVYANLTQALGDPDVSLASVANIIEQDMAMCAKVLQLANSAFFALPHSVSSVQAAIGTLGTATLRNLVLSVEVFRIFENRVDKAFSLEAMHQHSLLSAAIAKRLLSDARKREDAFAAALLHDVGLLVMAMSEPRARDAIAQAPEVHHEEIGAYLLGLWGLPHAVVEAVANHHTPSRVPHPHFDVVAAVHVANVLAHEQAGDVVEGQPRQSLDMAYLETLGVAGFLSGWRAIAADHAASAPTAA
jgi:HD-like signal output (HDOD) protein